MGKNNNGKPRKRVTAAKGKKRTTFKVTKGSKPPEKVDMAAHKYETTREHMPDAAPRESAFEDLGQLPQGYGTNTLYLVARDPHWLFSYWDIDWTNIREIVGDAQFYLKLFKSGAGEEFTTEINPGAKNWYLPVKEPGATYLAELGWFDDGKWKAIARSEQTTAPADKFSDDQEVTFATVPIHLTFQRLLDMVRSYMQRGETLIQALSRLQNEGRRLLFGDGRAEDWSEEQRQILTALFGKEAMDRVSMGSGAMDQMLRRELLEKLSSESASQLMARLVAALPGESSLFSGFAAGLLTGAGALGASEVSSWLGGLGLSSEVTSWQSAAGASWSAQPFGQQSGREFFMHVNAEVIFYGGTHPDAKLWIDGREIKLNPDGSFRFHFRFPEGNYEIPIVAQSPDGVEQRSASLRFERATATSGGVGATQQPEKLPAEPPGRRR